MVLYWIIFRMHSMVATSGCRGVYRNPLPPVRFRDDIGHLLRELGLTGRGVELGVQRGEFTTITLEGWRMCSYFVQVDTWQHLVNYLDIANHAQHVQDRFQSEAFKRLQDQISLGHARDGAQCINTTTSCAERYPDSHLDFIYVDARHDRKGVLEDLSTWWPKLRQGGIMAGHDYTTQKEPKPSPWAASFYTRWFGTDPAGSGQNWTLNGDGTVDESGRATKGAVDDFFKGAAEEYGIGGPPDLRECPRQLQVTYREIAWNSWIVRK